MLIIEAEDLEAQGVLYQSASEFVFHGKVMVSGLAFSMRLLQTAIDLCQQELDAGNFCLLVKKFNYITVWKEKQLEQSIAQMGGDSSTIAPAFIQQSQKSKPVIIDEPKLLTAEPLPGESIPRFSAAELSPYPSIRQSPEEGHSMYTIENGAAFNGRAQAQENGAMVKPIHHTNRRKADQTIRSAKSFKKPTAKKPTAKKPTAKKPTAFPPPNKSTPIVEQPAKLDPSFLERCQQALAYCIGPIAPLIVEEVLANNPPSSPNQLIDSLAEEIPNLQAAHEFRNRLKSM